MAQDGGFGNIIILGGLAVGGYYLWQWWSAQQTSTAAQTATTGTPTPATPAYQYTAPSASAQLATAAQGNNIVKAQGGQADAYQWATIYTGLGTGLPSISAVNINSTFFPSGLPANQTALANTPGYSQQGLPLMTPQTFIAGITSAGITGLSGLGQTGSRLVPVPIMLTPTSRTRMQLPAGTTPAELQRRLRVRE